jgi:hypothetical protein
LEGDIRGCLDNISHEWMLRHIPTDRVVLRRWLKRAIWKIELYSPRRRERKIWQAVWRWAKRRHPGKSAGWVTRKYWHPLGRRQWWFAFHTGQKTSDGKPIWLRLVNPADTKIVGHRKIREDANPFDPNWRPYFEDRKIFNKFGVHWPQARSNPS